MENNKKSLDIQFEEIDQNHLNEKLFKLSVASTDNMLPQNCNCNCNCGDSCNCNCNCNC